MLGWLLALPLAVLLGWLVWSIANGDQRPGDDGRPTATATADQPVSVEEAESTVQAFYDALEQEGLTAARQYLVDGVPVDEAIADGLDSVDVTDVSSTEQGQGVVQTVATATYTYGPIVIVQEETMQVARRGTEALIVQRVTRTLSNTGGGEQGGDDQGTQEGDDGSGNGNEGDGGDEGGGNGNEGGGNGGPGNGSQGRDG